MNETAGKGTKPQTLLTAARTLKAIKGSPSLPPNVTVADINQVPVKEWMPVQLLGDTNNGTYPLRPFSMFGSSVAFSEDGAWLAVGIPGRSTIPTSKYYQLQFHPYSGAVRIFRRQDAAGQDTNPITPYLYMGEVPNPNSGERFWDKFGSQVLWKTVPDEISGTEKTFLFITANAGWDGATTKFYNATPDSPFWPTPPTTDVSRAGVYVYQLTKPKQVAPISGSIVAPTGLLKYNQFIRQKSSIPLGTLGADIDVILRPAVKGDATELFLLVRDFAILPSEMDESTYLSLCPSGDCSYVTTNVDGQSATVNATGVVLEYKLDYASETFDLTGDTMASLNFPLPMNVQTNNEYTPNQWEHNDWFGIGLTTAYDKKYDRYITAVGAPRDGNGVFSFFLKNDETSPDLQWQAGQYLANDNFYRRSFFGQKLSFSPDARFLLVADPAGSGTSKGRGQVFLYYRRSETESLIPSEYNAIPKGQIPYGRESVPYFFDRLAELSKSSIPVTNFTTFKSDQYGYGVATNKFFVVVGAPVEQCAYTYALPAVVDFSDQIPTPPDGPGDYTIVRPSPTTNSTQPAPSDVPPDQAWLYGVIGGAGSLLVILPAAWLLLKYYHRKKVLQDLKNLKDVKALDKSEASLAQTQQDLSEGKGALDSTVTLDADH